MSEVKDGVTMTVEDNRDKVIVVLSGGMDSVTLTYYMLSMNYAVIPVSFNYGQKHKKELGYAAMVCKDLGLEHRLIDLSSLTPHIATSALTSDQEVPEGHYADDNMKATVVPNRNMVMLSIAAAIGVAEGAVGIATGIHAGDHAVYPDCRDNFRDSIEQTIRLGNEGFVSSTFAVLAPFVQIGKEEIADIGHGLGVDWTKTWSCYNGRELHCGKCGTCVERIEAFDLAGLTDPTVYEGE